MGLEKTMIAVTAQGLECFSLPYLTMRDGGELNLNQFQYCWFKAGCRELKSTARE